MLLDSLITYIRLSIESYAIKTLYDAMVVIFVKSMFVEQSMTETSPSQQTYTLLSIGSYAENCGRDPTVMVCVTVLVSLLITEILDPLLLLT